MFLAELYEMLENRFVYVRDGKFIEETLYLFRAQYENLCAKLEGKPHYVPEKGKLMDYINFNYWERPLEYEELVSHISSHIFPQHEANGKSLADEIFHQMTEDNFKGCMQTLINYEVVLEEDEESKALINILQRMSNNTRMRVHNGFTPLELSRITDEPIYILPDKLLEDDDDCHCGSKKTYKSCHKEADSKIRRLSEYRKK